MPDYVKTFKINVDISSAKTQMDNLLKSFNMTKREFERSFSASTRQMIESLTPKVNALFKAMNDLNFAKSIGNTEAIDRATKAIAKAKDALYESNNGALFVQQLEEAEEAANRLRLVDLGGTKSMQSELDAFKDAINAGSFGLTAEQQDQVNSTLKARQELLDQLSVKQAQLNVLSKLDALSAEDKLKLEEEIAELLSKINKDKPEEKADMPRKITDDDRIRAAWSPRQRIKNATEKSGYDSTFGMMLGKLGDNFYKAMGNAVKNIANFFVGTFKNAFTELNKMAQYDAGTSLYSNASARERQLMFGISGSQNYAMSTAMSMMNMQGIEDLMWANANQKRQFDRMTEILEAQYNKLESSGVMETAQQFQLDMAMMKLQFQNTVYQFIAAHRSQLEKVLEVALSFMEGVLTFLGWIVDGIAAMFGNNSYSSSDVLAASSNTTNTNTDNSRTITATVNYTNNQAPQESQSVISESVLNQLIAVLNS